MRWLLLLLVPCSLTADAADSDRDGLEDAAEAQHGTDPADGDTDGDGLPDGGEVLVLGSDPRVPDGRCLGWPTAVADLGPVVDATLADMDGDGDSDVVTVTPVGVLWHPVPSQPGDAVEVTTNRPFIDSVVAGDLDQDGDSDAVAWGYGPELTWFRNDGVRFVASADLALPRSPRTAILVDLDGDGPNDVVVATDGPLCWLRNLGGALAPAAPILDLGQEILSLDAADLDADGDLDLVFGHDSYSWELHWAEQLPGGSFADHRIPTDWARAEAARVGDFEGDGFPDIVYLADGDTLVTVRNHGGSFTEPDPIVGAFDSRVIAVADVDLDGDPDAVLGGADGPRWIETLADGEFGAMRRPAAEFDASQGLLPGDVDGDGDPDLGGFGDDTELVLTLVRGPEDDERDFLGAGVERCVAGTDPRVLDSDGGGAWDLDELWLLTDPAEPSDDLPVVDSDADGLSDVFERELLGSDPVRADTDGDGLSDRVEWSMDTDPLRADTDDDGLADGAEVLAGTDPWESDSDRDGVADGDEVRWGLDPLAPDSDGDGIGDGDELLVWGTDPRRADPDSDGDGLPDVVEDALGCDPDRTDTDGDGLEDGPELDAVADPLDADSDLDGVPDGAEVLLLGTDPGFDEATCVDWPATTLVNGRRSLDVASGDLDGDGRPDLVVLDITDQSVVWLRTTADGQPVEGGVIADETWVSRLDVFDLDGDGLLDVVWTTGVVEPAYSNLRWARNLGQGGFAPAATLASDPTRLVEVAGGDLDGDGHADVVVGSWNDLVIYFGLGEGRLAPPRVLLAGRVGYGPMRVADPDGDGDQDLVVWTSSPDAVLLLEQRPDGTLADARTISTASTGVALDLGDLDRDGDLDVVLAGNGGAVSWLENPGEGAWITHVIDPIFADLRDLGIGDVDDDGDLDVVAVAALEVVTWENEGGLFQRARWQQVSRPQGESVVVADLDLDEDADVALFDRDGVEIRWPGAHEDPDGDGLDLAAEVCVAGTDPELADQDGGGTSDLDELWGLGDPASPGDDGPASDTDGDGLRDAWEGVVSRSRWDRPDTDLDGVDDATEHLALHTSPTRIDTDGDSVPDGDELRSGSDPLARDTDGDRLDDGDELRHGIDPLRADTDADGLDDGFEVLGTRSDPARPDPDSDGDGLPDPAEGVRGTDALRADTDQDFAGDGDEVARGTDPLVPDTDGDGAPDGAEGSVVEGHPELDEDDCLVWPRSGIASVTAPFGDLAAVDVDRDGDADVVAGADGRLGVWTQLGPGRFGAPVTFDTGGIGADLEVIDVTGDRLPDLVYATAIDGVRLLRQRPGGGFAPPVAIVRTPRVPGDLAVADFDRDGALDVAWCDDQEVLVALRADGPLGSRPVAGPRGPCSVAAGDLDGDGLADLAYLDRAWLYLLQGLGDGTFAPAMALGNHQTPYRPLLAADLDGDRAPDLVATYAHGAAWFPTANDLGRTIAARGATAGRGLGAGDLDRDGDVDLVQATAPTGMESGQVSILESRGGVFHTRANADPGDPGERLEAAPADVDGDGDLDVVVLGTTALYWLEHVADDDTDEDGLTEGTERCLSLTSPDDADTDRGGADDLHELWLATDPLDPTDDVPIQGLALTGPLPGTPRATNTFLVTEAPPGGEVTLFAGPWRGVSPVQDCPGVLLLVDPPVAVAKAVADGSGRAELQVRIPGDAAGRTVHFQALAGCVASSAVAHRF